MRRCCFWRVSRGLAATICVSSLLGFPAMVGLGRQARAAAGVGQVASSSSDIEAASTLDLTGLQSQFSKIADRVSPEVVAISATCVPIESDDAARSESLNPQKLDTLLSKTTRTVGTGFFVDSNGFIVTNEHVICDAEQIWVTTDDKKVYPAIVIGTDPRADLAVLKIPAARCPIVKFAESGKVRRGQWTIAIGNPYGLANDGDLAMSVGVISATDRSLERLSSREGRLYSNLLQTTAEINPGNSGGPLFNLAGEVVGVNTAVILPQKQTNGIGFAIPTTADIITEINELKKGHEVVYGYLGVSVVDPTTRDRNAAGVDESVGGAQIDSIEAKGPADGSSLKVGDIVVSIDGHAVDDSEGFVRMIGRTPVNQPAKLTVMRANKKSEVLVTTHRRPAAQLAVNSENQRLRWHGITVSSVPTNWKTVAGEAPPTGLYVVGIDDADMGKQLGLKQGSIITAVAGKLVHTVSELQQVIDSTPPEKIKVQTADSAAVATAQQ